MSEILKINPSALHACIYYEFRRTKNVEKAFKNFCERVGDDVIEYVDFEYWFYRFYHGNLDFDHDRSTDPKPLILTDLPTEMLCEIVGNLDIRNRFNVRNVSRKFEPVVDKFKQKFGEISIRSGCEFRSFKQEVKFDLDNYSVYYEKGKNDYCFQSEFDEDDPRDLNIELSDLSAVLTNSKSPINHFRISTNCLETIDIIPNLIDALSEDVCPLFYAKRVDLSTRYSDHIIKLVSLFKPGVLEEIYLREFVPGDDTFAKLVETDQFKQSKSIEYSAGTPLSLQQIKRLSLLSSFHVRMSRVSAQDIVTLRDILSKFVNLESANISIRDFANRSEIERALGIDHVDYGLISYRHEIPNSDKSLILNINYSNVYVIIVNN